MNIQNPEEVVVSQELDQEEAAVLSYWTEDRMAAAEPLPFSIPAESIDDPDVSTPQPGEPMSDEYREPDGEDSLPRPKFSTSLVKNMNVFPYSCVGKLYMTFQGKRYFGSAYVIGESTIGTAGHCIFDGENWAKNVLFRARYNNGSYIGEWPIISRGTLNQWVENRNRAYDMAFGIAQHPIRPTTGRLGRMANYPADQGVYRQIGYPAEPIRDYPFNGERMWSTWGDYISHTGSYKRPRTIKAAGNMTGGCSGGPWMAFEKGKWRVNGVNSYRCDNDPYHIYSPYFGDAFIVLIKWMIEKGGDIRPEN